MDDSGMAIALPALDHKDLPGLSFRIFNGIFMIIFVIRMIKSGCAPRIAFEPTGLFEPDAAGKAPASTMSKGVS
jgi:hypothetical protein